MKEGRYGERQRERDVDYAEVMKKLGSMCRKNAGNGRRGGEAGKRQWGGC